MTPSVREARPEDLPDIAEIYAAAADTPATFDLAPLPVGAWEETLADCDLEAGRLLLVATDGDSVLGYAKSGRHKDKAAYDSTVETSIYVASDARGRRVGDALYRELLARLDRSERRLAVAGVTQPNEASNRLHRAHGFRDVGTFHQVGLKLGQMWDVLWFERPLGSR